MDRSKSKEGGQFAKFQHSTPIETDRSQTDPKAMKKSKSTPPGIPRWVHEFTYDPEGRLVHQTCTLVTAGGVPSGDGGIPTSYDYDTGGRLISVKDCPGEPSKGKGNGKRDGGGGAKT